MSNQEIKFNNCPEMFNQGIGVFFNQGIGVFFNKETGDTEIMTRWNNSDDNYVTTYRFTSMGFSGWHSRHIKKDGKAYEKTK